MANGGCGTVRCERCNRCWSVINIDWQELGKPLVSGASSRVDGLGGYVGRCVGTDTVLCFDCEPVTPIEHMQWIAATWRPPFLMEAIPLEKGHTR